MSHSPGPSECSRFLKAVADPERLRIVTFLQSGPRHVGQIAAHLGLPLANVSHHLKQLKAATVVTSKKTGRQVHYALATQIAKPGAEGPLNVLDFGCCRLELESGTRKGAERSLGR